LSVGHDTHGIMEGLSRFHRDIMIQDSERIARSEFHPDFAERRIRQPEVSLLPDLGFRQAGGPARQVGRLGDEFIDLARTAGDGNGDMSDWLHGDSLRWPWRAYPLWGA